MTNSLIDTLFLNGRGVISLMGAGGKTSLMFRLAKELTDAGKTVLTTTTTKIFMPKKNQSPDTIIEPNRDNLVLQSNAWLSRYPHFSAGSAYDSAKGKLKGFEPDIIDHLWQADIFDWIIVEADGARRNPLKASNSHEPVIPVVTTHLILVAGLDGIGKSLDEKTVHRPEIFSKITGLLFKEIIDEQSVALAIAHEIKKGRAFSHPLFTIVFLNKADTRNTITVGLKIAGLLKKNNCINRVITGSLRNEPPVKNWFDIQATKKGKKE